MKNQDKLKPITKNHIRYSILYYGVWKGIALYRGEKRTDRFYHPDDTRDRLVHITLTNIASLNNPNLLEFYKICS